MPGWFGVLFFVQFLVVAATIVTGFVLFDRIPRWLYHNARETWESLGRPTGIFWRPPGVSLFTQSPGQFRLWMMTSFRTPQWAREDPAAGRLVRQWHVYVIALNAMALLLLGSFVLEFLYLSRNAS